MHIIMYRPLELKETNTSNLSLPGVIYMSEPPQILQSYNGREFINK